LHRIVAIVEGHAEVLAVPVLLRRLAGVLAPGLSLEVPHPIRVKRQKLVKPSELERTIELAGRKTTPSDGILILLDSDQDCPKDLAAEIRGRAQAARPDRRIRVVLAKAEYEAWFLAAASSIAGTRGLAPGLSPPINPESIRDAKGWLSHRMTAGRSYRETLDQPAFSATFDLLSARTSGSFDKMWRDIASLLK